jgi:hypothetical protein
MQVQDNGLTHFKTDMANNGDIGGYTFGSLYRSHHGEYLSLCYACAMVAGTLVENLSSKVQSNQIVPQSPKWIDKLGLRFMHHAVSHAAAVLLVLVASSVQLVGVLP